MKIVFRLLLALCPLVLTLTLVHAAENPIPPKAPVKHEKDITAIISATSWTWEQGENKAGEVKFKKDGSCESGRWKARWKQVGERTVEISMEDGRTSRVEFSQDYSTFKGKNAEGLEVAGRRLAAIPVDLR